MSVSPPPPPPQGWWAQNWKWFVPTVGCVGCLLPLVLFGGCIAALFTGISGAMKNSPIYTEALSRANANPAVAQEMGTPLTPKGMVQGSINTNNGVTTADIRIPVTGPKKSGVIHAAGTVNGGSASFSTLTATPEGGASIDLLQGDSGGAAGDTGSSGDFGGSSP